MKEIIYENRKIISLIGIIIAVIGAFVAYFNYGTEPWETIGGFLCGLGLGVSAIGFSLKNPKEV